MKINELVKRIKTERGKYKKIFPRIIPEMKERTMYIKTDVREGILKASLFVTLNLFQRP
jgi:hypothetical protein